MACSSVCLSSERRHHDVLAIQLTLHSICQQILFILHQGYMFRLNISHLQALTTFSLSDALSTLGSQSVYSCGIDLVKTFQKGFDFVYKVCYLQIMRQRNSQLNIR